MKSNKIPTMTFQIDRPNRAQIKSIYVQFNVKLSIPGTNK